MRTTTTFAMVGLGSMIAGGIGWLVLSRDVGAFDFVNRHNQSAPIRCDFQLATTRWRRLATAGDADLLTQHA